MKEYKVPAIEFPHDANLTVYTYVPLGKSERINLFKYPFASATSFDHRYHFKIICKDLFVSFFEPQFKFSLIKYERVKRNISDKTGEKRLNFKIVMQTCLPS